PQFVRRGGDVGAKTLRIRRMLQHERALQVTRAVEPRRQPEVAFEQRARFSKQIKKRVARHGLSNAVRTATRCVCIRWPSSSLLRTRGSRPDTATPTSSPCAAR